MGKQQGREELFPQRVVGSLCLSRAGGGGEVLKSTAFSQSRNEALNYVENTMYFETSDLKIHFLMIRNREITIKYPYGPLYSGQHQ